MGKETASRNRIAEARRPGISEAKRFRGFQPSTGIRGGGFAARQGTGNEPGRSG
jgi:hypothetical protein